MTMMTMSKEDNHNNYNDNDDQNALRITKVPPLNDDNNNTCETANKNLQEKFLVFW
jgi:hypothetical protein